MGTTSCWPRTFSPTTIIFPAALASRKTTSIRCWSNPSILWRAGHTLYCSPVWSNAAFSTLHPWSRCCRGTVFTAAAATTTTTGPRWTTSLLRWRARVYQCPAAAWLHSAASNECTSRPIRANEHGTERPAIVHNESPHCSSRTPRAPASATRHSSPT